MMFVAYVLTLPVMVALDLLWIGFFMKHFYFSRLGFLLSGAVRPLPAAFFYLLFVGGLYYFAILPGHSAGSLSKTLLSAAILGFIAYGTYDLTNMATIAAWPLSVTIVDMVWGACIAMCTAAIGYGILVLLSS
jgi:uncharacterized membrane protein